MTSRFRLRLYIRLKNRRVLKSTGLAGWLTLVLLGLAVHSPAQQTIPVDRDNERAAVSTPEYFSPIKLDNGLHTNDPRAIIQQRNQGNPQNLSSSSIPANNDCVNAISLTVNAPCVNGTNKEATTQSGENSACQGSITKSVWYKFTATATSMFVEVELTATSGCYLSSAVYSGSCLPSTNLSCENASGGPNLNIHNLTGLTIGNSYLVQVSYTGGGPCGNNSNTNTGANFCIRVGTPQNCGTCNAPCGPMCIFPTNPTVAQVTSTCTAYPLNARMNAGDTRTECYTFTAVATSFSLQMIISAVGCGAGGNVSSFNWQLYPAGCGSVMQSGTLSNLNATGLTIGAGYVLCYTWTATCQHNTVYPYIVATSPLPVKWLLFDGKQLDKDILLTWSTASEINNDYFAVEKSIDGKTFETIGQVTGAGNSNQTRTYHFIDSSPFNGTAYYRITQVDYNGDHSASGIIAMRYYANYSVKVETNPVEDILRITIHSESTSSIKLMLINELGETVQEVSQRLNKGLNQATIPVEKLKQGMYFLKTESDNGISWTRFLKI